MKRFYVFRDGTMEGSAASRVAALDMIRQLQKRETHPFLLIVQHDRGRGRVYSLSFDEKRKSKKSERTR